jgi:RNA 3'-terminal phosphate cyclase (ATP)
MLDIDGSIGEGGGQILRSALTLSLLTGKPFRIRSIRARRRRPGLLRQHLTALEAATEVGAARVAGATLGAGEVTFEPHAVRGGDYRFDVGTAGSTTLVLQTVLPALIVADRASALVLEGGTHNPFAPPFDFLDRALLPLLRRMGARVAASLERPGFYPAGGGRMRVEVEPVARLARLELLERGAILERRAVARVAHLPRHIAERELAVLRESLSWPSGCLGLEEVAGAAGPGNVLTAEIVSENVTEMFTGFGQRGVSAEQVAAGVAREVRAYLAAEAPVGPHLADQLLVPLALAGGGSFRTVAPTRHTETNVEVVRAFTGARVSVARETPDRWRIELETAR